MTEDATTRPDDQAGASASGPVMRIVRGTPTAEEVAALVGVLAARSVVGGKRPPRSRPLWRRHESRIGAPLTAGPGAWRASGLPR